METRKHVVWICAAALATAVIALALSTSRDDAAPPKLAEPDLFPFIKPLDATAPPVDGQTAADDAIGAGRLAEFDRGTTHKEAQEHGKEPVPANIFATEQSVHAMRARGAGDDEVYRARAGAMSADAAAQLAQMEREESVWQARINAYVAERNALLGHNANASDPQSTLQQLRNARFTPEEQTRLAAYEWNGMPQLIQH